jgi:hypothetical protein
VDIREQASGITKRTERTKRTKKRVNTKSTQNTKDTKRKISTLLRWRNFRDDPVNQR